MLKIRDLSVSAEGATNLKLLKDIDATFADGKFYAITGPNGGGKTTLAKTLMGIVRPSSGTITLNGRDITDTNVTERAMLGLAYAFQTPPRFKGLSVRKLLELALGSDATEDAVRDVLVRVGLDAHEYLDRDAGNDLSGGEMKRIEFATVLARKPTVAIFDEPEAGIDLWSLGYIAEALSGMRADSGATMIVISHQERIIGLADEVLSMTGGRLCHRGTAADFLAEVAGEEKCGPFPTAARRASYA